MNTEKAEGKQNIQHPHPFVRSAFLTLYPLHSNHPTLSLSSTSASVPRVLICSTARQRHLLPWEEQCWHHNHYAILSASERRELLFLAAAKERGVIQARTSALCVPLGVSVCVRLQFVIVRVIKGEKDCSNSRAACCSSEGVMCLLLTHTHTHIPESPKTNSTSDKPRLAVAHWNIRSS